MELNINKKKKVNSFTKCVEGLTWQNAVYIKGFDARNQQYMELILQLSENRDYIIVYSHSQDDLDPYVYPYLADVSPYSQDISVVVEQILNDFFMRDTLEQVFPVKDLQVSATEVVK